MKNLHLIFLICLFLGSGCSDFSARHQVFECYKKSLDGEPLTKSYQDINYFHFNDERLNVSIGSVGIGISEYECEKTEFVYQCKDTRKDNFDDQITLDRYTLQAQQTLNTSKRTTIIDYSCGELERKVD